MPNRWSETWQISLHQPEVPMSWHQDCRSQESLKKFANNSMLNKYQFYENLVLNAVNFKIIINVGQVSFYTTTKLQLLRPL